LADVNEISDWNQQQQPEPQQHGPLKGELNALQVADDLFADAN